MFDAETFVFSMVDKTEFLSFFLSVCLSTLPSEVSARNALPIGVSCEPVNIFFGRKEEQKVKENQRQISQLLGLRQDHIKGP